jgi:hypothetical protein
MSRQQFRLLVVLHQLFVFGTIIVYELTVKGLPPEITQFLDVGSSVVEEQGGSGFPVGFDDGLFYGLTFLSVLSSLGLCLFHRWGRALFLFCSLLFILTSPVTQFYVNTGWSAMLGATATILEGMVIALAYFSHVRRMFAPAEAT